jgi:hypothetical protein
MQAKPARAEAAAASSDIKAVLEVESGEVIMR